MRQYSPAASQYPNSERHREKRYSNGLKQTYDFLSVEDAIPGSRFKRTSRSRTCRLERRFEEKVVDQFNHAETVERRSKKYSGSQEGLMTFSSFLSHSLVASIHLHSQLQRCRNTHGLGTSNEIYQLESTNGEDIAKEQQDLMLMEQIGMQLRHPEPERFEWLPTV